MTLAVPSPRARLLVGARRLMTLGRGKHDKDARGLADVVEAVFDSLVGEERFCRNDRDLSVSASKGGAALDDKIHFILVVKERLATLRHRYDAANGKFCDRVAKSPAALS